MLKLKFLLYTPILLFGWVGSISCTLSQRSKTFVYCSEGSPKIFNPQLSADGPSFEASGQAVYNRLLALNKKTLQPKASLAHSWTLSKDGLKLTLNLRKNVRFHKTKYFTPSRNFNADDVLFSFNRMRIKTHPYHKVNGGHYEYFEALGWRKLIKNIVKINDYQIQFIFSEANAPFLINLTSDPLSILSKEYGDELIKKGVPQKIDFEPIGTGPFILKSYLKDSTIRFKSHPHYFLGKTPLDQMVFSITPDASVRFQKLKTGECHFIRDPSPIDVPLMKRHPKVKVIQKRAINLAYIAFNLEKKPFDQVLVRKAIYHALNKKSYIKSIYLNLAEVAKNPLPPSTWGYNDAIQDYEYDLEKAKKFLKKAGYGKGFSAELFTLPISRPYNPNGKKMGELIQADLAKLGITLKLKTYKWATYLEKARRGEHEMLQYGWSSDNGDPSNFLEVLLTCKAIEVGSNVSRWCHKGFDALINKASKDSDFNKRSFFYKKAQEIFHKKVPFIPIAHGTRFLVMRKSVINFVPSPINLNSFYNVDLKN